MCEECGTVAVRAKDRRRAKGTSGRDERCRGGVCMGITGHVMTLAVLVSVRCESARDWHARQGNSAKA